MLERVTKQAKVFLFYEKLLYAAKKHMNKDRARLVPAAAVIPAVRVAATIIGSKASVAGLLNSL